MLVKIVVEKETIIEMSVMLSMMIVSWIVLWRLGKHRQRIMLSQKSIYCDSTYSDVVIVQLLYGIATKGAA